MFVYAVIKLKQNYSLLGGRDVLNFFIQWKDCFDRSNATQQCQHESSSFDLNRSIIIFSQSEFHSEKQFCDFK
jgi:hypothetical protein